MEEPAAEGGVADTAILLRRFAFRHVTDDGEGGLILQSDAFVPQAGEQDISVYVEDILVGLGQDADAALEGHQGFGLASFPASLAREAGFDVALDPDPSDGLRGQAHAIITGNFRPRSPRRLLAKGADIRVLPADP